jgi:hypothetical protein
MGRPFFRLGGTGDQRAFQTALRGSLILAVCAVVLLLTTPFLANYAVMNLALFLVLFAIGFLTARIPGTTFWTEFACLTTSAFVGLNPQESVASQTVLDTFIGLAFGMWIAALVGRLLWPILPQYVRRKDAGALGRRIKASTRACCGQPPVLDFGARERSHQLMNSDTEVAGTPAVSGAVRSRPAHRLAPRSRSPILAHLLFFRVFYRRRLCAPEETI